MAHMANNETILGTIVKDHKGYTVVVTDAGRFFGWPVGSNEHHKDPEAFSADTKERALQHIKDKVKARNKAKARKVAIPIVIKLRASGETPPRYVRAEFRGFNRNTGESKIYDASNRLLSDNVDLSATVLNASTSPAALNEINRLHREIHERQKELGKFARANSIGKRERYGFKTDTTLPHNYSRGRMTVEEANQKIERFAAAVGFKLNDIEEG